MSAIWGIFNLDGSPIDPYKLDAMKDAMADWGPDGSGVWHDQQAGLGHLLLYNTPESLREIQPLQNDSGHLVITAEGRIDNRAELFDALSVPHAERTVTSDGALMLKAYEKWGSDCPDHLLGDWSFAVWDRRERKLFIARDHHGNTSLYYHRSRGFFAFASSLKGLFALRDVPQQLNEWAIVRVITSWPPDGTSTCYEDVFALPPAHCMTVTDDRVDVQRYWYLEDAPELRLSSDQEYVEAFLDAYAEAVRCRLRAHRPVGITLSGGMDSGSVAGLAARELAARGERLPAFSSVPLYNVNGLTDASIFGDERPFIEATAQFAGNIDVHYIDAQDTSPLAGIERSLYVHDEPGHAAANAFWITSLLAEARRQNIGVLLTGQEGNATVSWPGLRWVRTPLAELLRQKQFGRIVYQHIITRIIPRHWITGYKRARARKSSWRGYSAINPDWARQHDLTGQMRRAGHDPRFPPGHDPREERFRITRPGTTRGGALWAENGAAYGMEVRDPTADKRLMEFCLGVPEAQYTQNGYNRYLFRRAMDSIMADEVRWNRRSGRQAVDIGYRIQAHWDETCAALEDVERSDLVQKYLDVPRMKEILFRLRERVDRATTAESGMILLRGLGVGLFLRRFDGERSPDAGNRF